MNHPPLEPDHASRRPPATELALVVLWEHARHAEDRILADLTERFDVLATTEVAWSPDRFGENLTRFYGTLLPPGSDKETHCGSGPFLAIILRDPTPTYEVRPTSKGPRRVAKRVFDSKARYREWTGGGHRIHASNDPFEVVHDLHLLLGIDFDGDPLTQIRGLPASLTLSRDLPGTNGWSSAAELFRVLNHTIQYVVLRNFEGLPEQATLPGHDDVDLLVASFGDALHLLDARRVYPDRRRVHVAVDVGDREVRFDLRHPGDRYLPRPWADNVLASRIRHPKGFYVPDDENHFYALLYHALVHKERVAPDYLARFAHLAPALGTAPTVDALGRFMLERGYELAPPLDRSVGFHAPRALLETVPTAAAGRWRHTRGIAKEGVKRGLATIGLLDAARAAKRRLMGNGQAVTQATALTDDQPKASANTASRRRR